MPVTARDISRRALLATLAAPLLADASREAIDLFSVLASALSEGNGLSFLDRIDHAMEDYQKLEQDILALTAQNEVLSSIDVLKQEGDDHARAVEVDWFLQIRSREQSGPLERRREIVKCRIELKKRKWKVISLEPLSFFAPPETR